MFDFGAVHTANDDQGVHRIEVGSGGIDRRQVDDVAARRKGQVPRYPAAEPLRKADDTYAKPPVGGAAYAVPRLGVLSGVLLQKPRHLGRDVDRVVPIVETIIGNGVVAAQ